MMITNPIPFFPQRPAFQPEGLPGLLPRMEPVIGYVEVKSFDDPQVEAIRQQIIEIRADAKQSQD